MLEVILKLEEFFSMWLGRAVGTENIVKLVRFLNSNWNEGLTPRTLFRNL